MVGAARPCPVSIADQMPNTMIPQWHRGSAWAVAQRARFRDEVAERVRAGVGRRSQERVRLMWIGAGLWHDPGFYSALEERLRRGVRVVDVHAVCRARVYPRGAGTGRCTRSRAGSAP